MPFKSKAQMRKFFLLEKKGKLPEGKAEQWAKETPNLKGLPNHIKKNKKNKKVSEDKGKVDAHPADNKMKKATNYRF